MSDSNTVKPEVVRKVARLAEVTAEKVTAEVTETTHAIQAKITEAARTAFEFQSGAISTLLEAGKIYGEGLKALAAHAAHVNKVHFDETVAAMRSLATTRSVNEALRLQTEFARSTATRAMSETTKLMQDYMKLAEQASAPVTAKVHEAVEKFAKAA
jgi:hypothetical protein